MDAEQRVKCYKNLMTKHHDAMVKPRQFNIRDIVLKRVSLATKSHKQVKSLDAEMYHHKPPLYEGKTKHHVVEQKLEVKKGKA